MRLASHSAQTLDAVTVANVEELKAVLMPDDRRVEVAGIDEAQFFDASLISLAMSLVRLGAGVILAGWTRRSRASPSRRYPDLTGHCRRGDAS